MEKDNINREHLQDNIMKHIIFRFDYQGMIDSTDFVKKFHKYFNGQFLSYSKNTHNQVDLLLNNIEDISNTLSIPVNEISKQDIHVFSNNTFGTDKLTLNISVYNTILNIECANYKNIDPYLDFINRYISFLFEQESYINLKRFGLRKIGSNIYDDFNSIHRDLEKEYFSFKESYFEKYSLFRSRIEDVLILESSKLKINYIRHIDTGNIVNNETSELTKAFQVFLDLDAYLDEEALQFNKYKENLPSLITNINNDILFNLFKNSVTTEFLNKNLAP